MALMSLNGVRPGLFLGLRMHGAQAADIDDQLLALRREAVGSEQLRGVRVRRRLEHAGRADDQRRAFGGIDRLRPARPSRLIWKMLYSLPSAITARSPSASLFGGSADDCTCMMFCLASFSKISPAEIALHLIGRGHDRAAVARMRLDDLALPFRVEQVGKALRRVFLFHQVGVVGDDAQPDAEAGELPSGSLCSAG